MQFVMLIADDKELRTDEDQAVVYEKIGAWWMDLAGKGKIVGGNQLQPSETAKTVRLTGPKPVITDGPFIESREVLGGYGVLECADIDEAVAIAKSWPGPNAIIEVRPTVAMG